MAVVRLHSAPVVGAPPVARTEDPWCFAARSVHVEAGSIAYRVRGRWVRDGLHFWWGTRGLHAYWRRTPGQRRLELVSLP